MNFDSVFFDLDGTISESHPGVIASMKYMCEKLNVEFPGEAALYNFIGPPINDIMDKLFGFSPEQIEHGTRHFIDFSMEHGMYMTSVYPGLEDILSCLKAKGKKVFLATARRRENACEVLDYLGLTHYFDYISGLSFEHEVTTKQKIITEVLNKYDDLGACCMVGDRYLDIEGGKACGIYTVGVLYGYGTLEELNDAAPDFLASDSSELKKILLGDI